MATFPHIKKAFTYLPTTGRSFDFIILSLSDNRERRKVIAPCSFYLNGFPEKNFIGDSKTVTTTLYRIIINTTAKYRSKASISISHFLILFTDSKVRTTSYTQDKQYQRISLLGWISSVDSTKWSHFV